jgi:hypothetical protein
VNIGNLPTDGAGNVKVASQGTTTVSGTVGVDGTVSVGNLPVDGNGNLKTAPQGTQNVNVTGGTVSSAPAVQKLRQEFVVNLARGGFHIEQLTPISGITQVSFVSVEAGSGNDLTVSLEGLEILHLHGDFQSIVFPSPIQANNLSFRCNNDLFHGDCNNINYSVAGN